MTVRFSKSLILPTAAAAGLLALGVSGLATRPAGDAPPTPPTAAADPDSPAVDFNRDVRPILVNNCMACHGGVMKAGGVSFLFREEAMVAGDSGKPAITPFDPAKSHLLDRVANPKDPMPPEDHGPMLDADQVEILRQWIAIGAPWEDYWSFVTPKKPAVPEPAGQREWIRTEVDAFILDRLTAEGLSPSPEAGRAALLRRASLDLTGLPPTPEELDALLSDEAPDAYERAVDRLLASPAYGQRWASVWLDLARFADTQGYEKDGHRNIWPYRDWLVRSLNANLPYSRMLIDQMAGDLLPEPTLDQILATAFHRNTQTNTEGGTDDEEFRTLAVMDRVATVWQAFGGVTFHCVQCHSHPYDPIRHEEYFDFLAFFNGTLDADLPHDFPKLRVPDDPARHDHAARLFLQLHDLRHEIHTAGIDLHGEDSIGGWKPARPLQATTTPKADYQIDGSHFQLHGTAAGNLKLRAEFASGNLQTLTALRLDLPPENPETARHSPEHGFIITRAKAWIATTDGENTTELQIARVIADSGEDPRDPRGLLKDNPQGLAAEPVLIRERRAALLLESPAALPPGARIILELQHQPPISEKPAVAKRLALAISDAEKWTALANDPAHAARESELNRLTAEYNQLKGIDVPVMVEARPENQRDTSLFLRGNWLEKSGEVHRPGVPGVFPNLPDDAPADRLALARWMIAPDHPLTARVAVNRFWEQLFGTGLVETAEDFGSIGTPPSHPELLDWLARHFQDDLGWDQKALLRLLVTSAAYRQDAAATPELLERDPFNRLLARGPRQRLSAEMVRDQALLASGLLSLKQGGPPVMPPQPDGVWNVAYSGAKWTTPEGEDRYRRALYTYWRRTSPYPSFLTFDTPNRDVCSVRRIATNTPLQALVTFNDPVYHEAATALAALMQQASPDLDARLAHGHLRVVGQEPSSETLVILRELFDASAKQTGNPATALANVAAVLLNMDAAMVR